MCILNNPTHRLVNWLDYEDYPETGIVTSCGATEEEYTTFPSHVTCDICIMVTPGLQIMAKLKSVFKYQDLLFLSVRSRELLRELEASIP